MLVKTNGVKIHCELSGEPDAPVVVLSHSLGSSMVMWEPQREVLVVEEQGDAFFRFSHGDRILAR